VIGLARNSRLLAANAELMKKAEDELNRTVKKQRLCTWTRPRWVIAKAEHTEQGATPRFILTNVVGDAQKIHDRRYFARGEMENRVKEQMMLFRRPG
jgi:hypothetical protein